MFFAIYDGINIPYPFICAIGESLYDVQDVIQEIINDYKIDEFDTFKNGADIGEYYDFKFGFRLSRDHYMEIIKKYSGIGLYSYDENDNIKIYKSGLISIDMIMIANRLKKN
jgi:hypothetical protein